ncbi:MAG: hypothetical protein U0R49_07900 [Fimbriimonadales bacterium]
MLSELSDSNRYGIGARRMVAAVARSQASVPVLFVGEPGAGQNAAAADLAAVYLCQSPLPESACGECSACRNFRNNKSPDLLPVEADGKTNIIRLYKINGSGKASEEPSKANDAGKSADELSVVPITKFIRVGPVQARNKVVLIVGADRLNSDSANALLKTLEEAPSYVRFVLTSDAAGRIMQTVRSRCCIVPCDYERPTHLSQAALNLSAGTPELAEKLASEQLSLFAERFWIWLQEWQHRPNQQALKVSEEFQILCDEYHEIVGGKVSRTTRTEMLKMLCNGISALVRDGNRSLVPMLAEAIEAHRAVAGNITFNYVCDSMFCSKDF